MAEPKPKRLHLPRTMSRFQLLNGGAISWVLKVDARIVIKIPRKAGSKEFAHEIKIYDILENATPCPDIVQSFLHHPNGIFLPLACGGSIAQRIEANLARENQRAFSRVLQVQKTEPRNLVERWTMELCNAAAWIESLGYAHTDLRPENLLYYRCLGSEAGVDRGTFGYYGAQTESFAIGSLLYLGHELFEMEEWDVSTLHHKYWLNLPPLVVANPP